jgi:hypothetical protein
VRQNLRAIWLPLLMVYGAALAFSQAPAADPEWKEYSYADDGFALKAPAPPTFQKVAQPTASGSIEMRQYSVDLTKDVGVLMGVSDFPDANQLSDKQALEEGVTGSIQATNAKKTSEKDIALQQMPGIEFEADTASFHMLGRYYWKKGRLFALMAVSPLGQPVPADALRVMNSLKFIASAPGQASKPEWKEFSYPSEGFAMTAPVQPALEKEQHATASGNIELREYSVDLTDSLEVVMSVSDIPNPNQATPKAILQGAVDGSLPPDKATRISQKDIELQQVPGIEFEARNGDYRLLGRYYWRDGRLFTFLAIAPWAASMPAEAVRVMDSLKFLAK